MRVERINFRNFRRNWVVFLLLAPTVLGVAVFRYIPAFEAVRHSFYHWDGAFTEEFVGLENLRQLLGDLSLWGPLAIGAALSGLSAVISSGRLKRIFRVAGVCLLLVTGVLVLRDILIRLALPEQDTNALSVSSLTPLFVLLGLWVAAGIAVIRLSAGRRRKIAVFMIYFLPVLTGAAYLIGVCRSGDWLLWMSFRLILILVVANLFKMWPSIFAAVCIHRLRSDRCQYLYRVLFVVPMIIPRMVGLLIWKFFYDPNVGVLNKFLIATGLDNLLIWLDKWVLHLGVFVEPFKPAWLGHPDLIIPSLIFWGFPWVGVVGVLIYLAGLQNISQSVYEAAEMDGINWWGKFWRIELPLIMTQVRLNLILMIIGTFQAYGFQYVLLGAEGGPRNKGLTPGLYMFYQAFQEQNYGYACAIGLLLFFIILTLTIINQRYVRVEK